MVGSNNADAITGGTGADTITGGAASDTMTGNAGNDTFVFASSGTTRNALFTGSDTTTANVDRITDFRGNGAAAGDTITLATGANAFGAALTFTAATNTAVTTVAITTAADAADFTTLAAAIQAAAAGTASTAAVAQVYDVTVTAGNLAGHFLVVNDDAATITAIDAFINVTGITGALDRSTFSTRDIGRIALIIGDAVGPGDARVRASRHACADAMLRKKIGDKERRRAVPLLLQWRVLATGAVAADRLHARANPPTMSWAKSM